MGQLLQWCTLGGYIGGGGRAGERRSWCMVETNEQPTVREVPKKTQAVLHEFDDDFQVQQGLPALRRHDHSIILQEE